MKAVYFYLLSRFKRQPISWAEAKHQADQVSCQQYLTRMVDCFLLKIVSFTVALRMMVKVDLGKKFGRACRKLEVVLKSNCIGRYLIRVANAKTDLRDIAYSRHVKPGTRRT